MRWEPWGRVLAIVLVIGFTPLGAGCRAARATGVEAFARELGRGAEIARTADVRVRVLPAFSTDDRHDDARARDRAQQQEEDERMSHPEPPPPPQVRSKGRVGEVLERAIEAGNRRAASPPPLAGPRRTRQGP